MTPEAENRQLRKEMAASVEDRAILWRMLEDVQDRAEERAAGPWVPNGPDVNEPLGLHLICYTDGGAVMYALGRYHDRYWRTCPGGFVADSCVTHFAAINGPENQA